MSRARRVGGPGWAGVHGSFIGLSKTGSGGKPSARVGKKPKKKPKKKPASIKINLASIPDNEEVQKAGKRVLAVQADIEKTKKRLTTLENQLALAMDKLKIARNLTNPLKGVRKPKRPIAKDSKK